MTENQAGQFWFKGYQFQYLPQRFSMEQQRNLRIFEQPFISAAIQDMGFSPLILEGEGVLPGENCMEEWEKLKQLQQQNGSGLLCLANSEPIYCYFEQLSAVGQAGPKLLTYHFRFVEDCARR